MKEGRKWRGEKERERQLRKGTEERAGERQGAGSSMKEGRGPAANAGEGRDCSCGVSRVELSSDGGGR